MLGWKNGKQGFANANGSRLDHPHAQERKGSEAAVPCRQHKGAVRELILDAGQAFMEAWMRRACETAWPSTPFAEPQGLRPVRGLARPRWMCMQPPKK